MKHTPGPWAPDRSGHGTKKSPRRVTIVGKSSPSKGGPEPMQPIAWLGGAESNCQTQANALLIAAAPDLLKDGLELARAATEYGLNATVENAGRLAKAIEAMGLTCIKADPELAKAETAREAVA